ncbi:Na(+)-translocating NADH-quinone reductase subunit C [subsurface metagenome]
MVIIVAAVLSVIAIQLKPHQDMNIKLEAMQNILTSVRVESNKKNAEELFKKYITDGYVVNPEGEKLQGVIAFDVDLKKEVAKIDKIKKYESQIQERRESPFKNYISGFINFKTVDKKTINSMIDKANFQRQLPVFVCEKEREIYYVIPLWGKGLWGPIWGYRGY